MILLVDNYDSFTHNLWQLLRSCLPAETEVTILRNDARDVAWVRRAAPSHVILSPGPGHPRDAGLSVSLPEALPATPILGVCLGHQALAHAVGAAVTRSPRPTHGRSLPIAHDGSPLFAGCPSPFDAALYHSLVVDEATLPDTIQVTARSPAGDVMALRHRERPHQGLQFHPESFMTTFGPRILENFLRP